MLLQLVFAILLLGTGTLVGPFACSFLHIRYACVDQLYVPRPVN